jgi:hypothetical protein
MTYTILAVTGSELAKLDVSLQCSGLGIVLTSSQLSDLSRMQVRSNNADDVKYMCMCKLVIRSSSKC